MTGIRTGGCQCGALRYELNTEPITLYACHCSACQKQSSSAFGMSLRVPRSGFAVTRGVPREWRRRADSGREVICHFCGDCGSRLFHCPSPESEFLNIKAGTLEDTKWLRPVGHVWTGSAQGWVALGGDVLVYEGQPEDFAPLIARWQERHGEGRS